jgi:mannose-6-phosphate isomerase-like protein (cupin superfamily)
MESAISSVRNRRVREWYKKNVNPKFLDVLVERAERDGYVLDPDSGLLIKRLYSDETIKRLGFTVVNIIFPRPVDLHYHEDVDEALLVVKGKGLLYIQREEDFEKRELYQGTNIFVPKGMAHSFRPDTGAFLEIMVACSGIIDPKKEVCVEAFDEFEPWKEYYTLKIPGE